MEQDKSHWEKVYQTKDSTEVSWYRNHLDTSLAFIEQTGISRDARIIDVGGGASTLVDDLLAQGYANVSVLDISAAALATAKARLGAQGEKVQWLEADITRAELPHHYYDVWHDRAVFHFLTGADDRQHYVERVLHAVKPGGHIIMACFGPDGPLQCSGLDTVRYSPDRLHGEFGAPFRLVNSASEDHRTPFGKEQQFVYCYCRVEADN
ncbi:MAG: class I SAM-dependent methyltransferase [Sulfuricellaceae bacterium]|nr:class I SAM-dependent methyltransferase [Sulfuricellaceae bacterium]